MPRLLRAIPFLLAAWVPLPATALERMAARLADPPRRDPWYDNGTCTITYYNFCTGWIWLLSGFAPGDALGVCYESCCGRWIDINGVRTSWHHVWEASPQGYGFTGTIAVSAADPNCCPTGLPIEAQPFLPTTGWNAFGWTANVPERFVMHATLGPGIDPPLVVTTDHPAAVGGGPVACGTCYPSTRVNRSYYYGNDALCPGEPLFHDGTCYAQLLWDCDVQCPVPVESSSWGALKSLYR